MRICLTRLHFKSIFCFDFFVFRFISIYNFVPVYSSSFIKKKKKLTIFQMSNSKYVFLFHLKNKENESIKQMFNTHIYM